MDTRTRITLLLAFLLPVLLAGCGYSVHSRASLPFTEIRIGKVENRTLEPKLEDKLHRALAEEFERNGITVSPGAAPVISGVIRNFTMISLSEKKGTTVEYQIIVQADFTFQNAAGKVSEIWRTESPFIVPFSGSETIADLVAARDIAERKAMADIAMEVVGSLIYK
ncbi:MAG: hypothetical protein FIA94_08925 [Nitrospirae bacterium]|nr:hypothetical protein [Nitrospirota bacterium]